MWITTDRGICKYDSYNFTTFSTNDGLAYPTNFSIFPDRMGRLWFTGYDGSLTILENGVFRPYEFNEQLKEKFIHRDFCSFVGFDREQNLLTYGVEQHYFDDTKNEILVVDDHGNVEVSSDTLTPIAYEQESDSYFKAAFLDSSPIFKFGSSPLLNQTVVKQGDRYIFSKRNNSKKREGSLNSIYYTDDNFVKKLFATKEIVNQIYTDEKDNVFVCTANGLIFISDIDKVDKRKSFFGDVFVSSIKQDREGNYWMSSRDGLFFIPSFSFEEIGDGETVIKSLAPFSNKLLFIKGENEVYGIDKNSSTLERYFVSDIELSKLYYDDNSINFFLSEEALLFNEVSTDFDIVSSVDEEFLNKENCHGLPYVLKNFSYVEVGQSCIFLLDSFSCDYWVGSLIGLEKYQVDPMSKISDIGELIPSVSTRITDFVLDSRRNLWVATIGEGVSSIKGDSSLLINITIEDGLSSNHINNIFLENDSTLWACTNLGLNKIKINSNYEVVEIVVISNLDGLRSNYINDFVKWNEKYWVSTNFGLSYIDTNFNIGLNVQPSINILDVVDLNDSIHISNGLKLESYQNDLKFSFLGISYRKPSENIYDYRLKYANEEVSWKSTNERSVTFNSLKPGSYDFEVRMRNKYNVFSEVSAFEFVIRPHFTETIWFFLFIGLLIFSSIYFVYRYRMRQLKKLFQVEKGLNEAILKKDIAELSTFRNQFNPHFVFNFLNSMQSHVMAGDFRKANYYISRFSKLIREGLSLMNKDLIPLQSEVNYISEYLDLEINRFPNKFKYSISISEELPLDLFLVPPLIIQPVIENVLKHAFNVNSKGTVKISVFEESEDIIVLEITDDGKGMQKEDNLEKSKRESFGLKITKDRIDLLNLQYPDTTASFSIFTNKHPRTGTTAIFKFPKIEADGEY